MHPGVLPSQDFASFSLYDLSARTTAVLGIISTTVIFIPGFTAADHLSENVSQNCAKCRTWLSAPRTNPDSMSDFSSLRSCEALFHTSSDASAARRRSDTGRYYSVWDLTIQVTSCMISPDLVPWQGKDAISAIIRGLLSRRFSDIHSTALTR